MTTYKKKRNTPSVYDKEGTKAKLIKAVGRILTKEGFQNIRINRVAEVSGVAKKSIYIYFGGLDGLIKAYLSKVDFWQLEKRKSEKSSRDEEPEITKDFMFELLKGDFNYFFKSSEMQKIVLWGISERNKLIHTLIDEREEWGEKVFQKTDELFKGSEVDYRATIVILVSAIYYTVLHIKANNGTTMCGIDMTADEGKDRILKALDRLLSLTYKYADVPL